MESLIGYSDVKRAGGVFFHVRRRTNYVTAKSKIPYEYENWNIGKAMNLATGVFTAPVQGRYHFSFHCHASKYDQDKAGLIVQMWVNNGYSIGSGYAFNNFGLVSISGLASLNKGDQVYAWLYSGKIYDTGSDPGSYTTFSGMLLEEDISL